MPDNLTDKQEQFCQEYLIDLNATQAAIRAGYSEKTAKEQGCRLFTNVNVERRIAEMMAARSERTEITVDWVLDELKPIASVALDDDNVKVVEKIKALELLARHLGMLTDKVQHGVTHEFADFLAGLDGRSRPLVRD